MPQKQGQSAAASEGGCEDDRQPLKEQKVCQGKATSFCTSLTGCFSGRLALLSHHWQLFEAPLLL